MKRDTVNQVGTAREIRGARPSRTGGFGSVVVIQQQLAVNRAPSLFHSHPLPLVLLLVSSKSPATRPSLHHTRPTPGETARFNHPRTKTLRYERKFWNHFRKSSKQIAKTSKFLKVRLSSFQRLCHNRQRFLS